MLMHKPIESDINLTSENSIARLYESMLSNTMLASGQAARLVLEDKCLDEQDKQELLEFINTSQKPDKLTCDEDHVRFHIKNKESGDKFVKFKNLMAALKLRIDESTYLDSLGKGIDNIWYRVKMGTVLTLKNIKLFNLVGFLEDTKNHINTTQNSIAMQYDQYGTHYNSILSKISFIGEKVKIKQIEKKFKDELSFLGIKFEENNIQTNKTHDAILSQLQEKIQGEFNIGTATDGTIVISCVEGLDDKLKYNFYEKIFIPKILQAMSDQIEFISKLSTISSKNHYIKMLNNFATINGLEPDLAKNLLSENPQLLSQSSGFSKIMKYREQILHNYTQHESLVKTCVASVNMYLQLSQIVNGQISNLSVDPKQKEQLFSQFHDTLIYNNKIKKTTPHTLTNLTQRFLETTQKKNAII